ncbi:MAG TPA: hypothetical protein VER97_15400 [Geodermatophilus sp.]|nr:hypothetical protein [Geodermatophilus sp.]
MTALSTRQRWILQPLTDAGLAGDQVSTLLFRLAFDTAVDPAAPSPLDLHALARDQPVHVRRAWLEVLDRMTAGHLADAPPTGTPGCRNDGVWRQAFPLPSEG